MARRRITASVIAVLLGGTVAGCTGTTNPSGGVEPESTTSPTTSTVPMVRAASREEAALHLWVSNQSFADDLVDLTISIDGVQIVDQRFSVGNQHNWILFPIDAPPGPHVLKATSDSGAETTNTFHLPERGKRHAVVDYWQDREKGSPRITWQIQSKPMIFR